MILLALLATVAAVQVPLLSPRTVIGDWVFNKRGDATVIRTESHGLSGLHLLAINAQDPISTTQIGDIDSRTLVTFLNDTAFVTLEPTASDLWTLTSKELVYSVDEGAAPPTIGRTILLDELQIEGRPRDLVFVEALGMFVVVEDGGSSIASLSGLIIEELVTNGTHIIFSAHADSFSEVYVSDLIHPPRVIGGSGGLISSVQVASDGSVAWLEDQGGGNELWLFNKTLQRIKTGVEADSVIFWQDSRAIALLADAFLHQMWLDKDTPSWPPVRIPSTSPILEAAHVGITPLNHSHYVALQADQNLYIVSSNPWDRPDQGFENIRLTDFT